MPDELIIDTFKYVHADIFDGPPETCFHEWIRLLHVCRRWRSIIHSVSDLWHIINITPKSTPGELAYSLSLCGDQPLDVRFLYLDPKLVSDSSRLLSPKLSTIQCLTLRIFHLDYDNPPFGDILSFDMPALQELRIVPRYIMSNHTPDHQVVALRQYPLLQCLELGGITCPPDIANLRILHLRRCSLLFSFDGFVRVLGCCAQLEDLQLDSTLSSLAATLPQTAPSALPSAKLDRLRFLFIDDRSARAISDTVSHIDAPGITTLRILCYTRHRPEAEHLLRTLFPGDSSPSISSSFTASPVKVRLYLKGNTDTCIIETSESSTSPAISTSLSLYVGFDFERECTITTALHDTAPLLANMRVSEFSLAAGMPIDVPPAVWEEIFSSMPFLERLDLRGYGGMTEMCQGLHHASVERRCCPRLMSIQVQNTSQSDLEHISRGAEVEDPVIWMDSMRDTMRERAQAGMKLRELVVGVFRSYAGEGSHFPRYDTHLAQLRPFVERVEYEDICV